MTALDAVELSTMWMGWGTASGLVGRDRRWTTSLSMNEAQAPQSIRAVRVAGGDFDVRLTCTGIVSSGRTSTDIRDRVC